MLRGDEKMIHILQDLYDSEINFGIFSFWDSGYQITLGDPVNGIHAREDFEDLEEGLLWLAKMAVEKYPKSDFAKSYEKLKDLKSPEFVKHFVKNFVKKGRIK